MRFNELKIGDKFTYSGSGVFEKVSYDNNFGNSKALEASMLTKKGDLTQFSFNAEVFLVEPKPIQLKVISNENARKITKNVWYDGAIGEIFEVTKNGYGGYSTIAGRGFYKGDYEVIGDEQTKEFKFSNGETVNITKNGEVERKSGGEIFTPEAIKAYGKWTKTKPAYSGLIGVSLPYDVSVPTGLLKIGCLQFDIQEFREFIKVYEEFVD